MRRALLLLNGQLDQSDGVLRMIESVDDVYCADGGSRHARNLGLIPCMIIGDSDSITAEDADFFRKRNVPFRSFPSGKDATDGEIALGIVVNEGYDEILVAGWGGGRTDHLLSNIAMLERYSKLARISFISRHERVEIIRGRNVIAGKTGATVSLLALTGRACVSLRGFEYPLTDEMIKRGSSRGVSNIIRSERAHVTVHSGTLLMIIQEEQE